jgi:hypothetical protein
MYHDKHLKPRKTAHPFRTHKHNYVLTPPPDPRAVFPAMFESSRVNDSEFVEKIWEKGKTACGTA